MPSHTNQRTLKFPTAPPIISYSFPQVQMGKPHNETVRHLPKNLDYGAT